MPTVAPTGWTPDFSDDFTGTSVAADKGWWTYSGAPGGDTDGAWDPSHLVMSNGELRIEGYQDSSDTSAPADAYVTGGLKTRSSQTYGKYEVRFRMDQGKGISFAVLLWPANGGWPPEIDFAEDNGASPRTLNTATLHYGADNTTVVRTFNVDMTQWHTLGVEWLPDSITYTIDGQVWATVTGSEVPDTPMNLAIQTEAWGCHDSNWEQCPDSTTPSEVDMDVDWAVAYAPASATPEATQAPTISGTLAEGQTLSATPGAWQSSDAVSYSYQWQRCTAATACTDIPGATSAFYTTTSADVGDGLTAVVTATDSQGQVGTASSTDVGPITNLASPGNVVAPAIFGVATDGQVLSVRTGTWLGAPGSNQTYQWQRCVAGSGCSNIAGMVYGTYRTTAADVGSTITVEVTATTSHGTTLVANADPTAAVAAPPPPANTSAPTVTGTNADGTLLTATAGTWTSPDKLTHTFQWQRCNDASGSCVSIKGETYSTYHPTSADVGSTLQVAVLVTDQEGQTSIATAEAGTTAAPTPPVNTKAPSIAGTAEDGQLLTLSAGSWQSPDVLSYSYEWLRCSSQTVCTPISGEWYSTYHPTSADVGSGLEVIVTAVDQERQLTSATSAVTAIVAAPAPPTATSAPSVSGKLSAAL